MMKKTLLRLFLDFILLYTILFAGWISVALVGFILLTFFLSWEVILFAIFADLLYGVNSSYIPWWTLSATVLYFAFGNLRSKLF